MRLFKMECKKVLFAPLFWVFFILCLGVNTAVILGQSRDAELVNYASTTARQYGPRMGKAFRNAFLAMPESQEKRILFPLWELPENKLEGYDTALIAEEYLSAGAITGYAARQLQEKYAALQPAVERLGREGASLDYYLGPLTNAQFLLLFGTVCKLALAEGALLCVLMTLFLTGYERQNQTMELTAGTKTGRKLAYYKLAAGVGLGMAACLLLFLGTLAVYFSVFDYSGVWQANVASQFHTISEWGETGLFTKPFLTWGSFTVAQYLLATLGLSLAITALFGLLAGAIGVLVKNSYLGFLVFALIAAVTAAAPQLLTPAHTAFLYYLSQCTLIQLWNQAGTWFSEMGSAVLFPWQECLNAAANLLFCAGAVWVALCVNRRRDLA